MIELAGGASISLTPWFVKTYGELSSSDRKSVMNTIEIAMKSGFTPGMRLHEVEGYTSISPSLSVRILGVRLRESLALVHVARHDDAYEWAKAHEAALTDDRDSLEIINVKRAENDTAPDLVADYGDQIARKLAGTSIPSDVLNAIKRTQCEADLL